MTRLLQVGSGTRAVTLDLDITYVIVLALFLVPLLVFNGIVIKPFLKLFEERHERLEGAVQKAEAMLAEANEQAQTFEERIRVATEKGLETRARIRSEATQKMNGQLDDQRKRLATKLEGAMSELDKKRREALADVHVEAEKIAELTASKLLGRAL